MADAERPSVMPTMFPRCPARGATATTRGRRPLGAAAEDPITAESPKPATKEPEPAINTIEFVHYPRRAQPHPPAVGLRVDGVDLRLLVAAAVTPLWALASPVVLTADPLDGVPGRPDLA